LVNIPRKDFDNVVPEFHLIVATCGGIIESERGIISFLENEEYTNNLRCAWTIRSPLFSKKLYMTKLFSGFELGNDYWLLLDSIQRKKLKSQCKLANPKKIEV